MLDSLFYMTDRNFNFIFTSSFVDTIVPGLSFLLRCVNVVGTSFDANETIGKEIFFLYAKVKPFGILSHGDLSAIIK